jgi:hypothetical protein
MFLLPGLIFGTLLAVLPVALHLWRRRQATPVRWAAMQFLHASKLTGRRSRSIQNWLLLLVRMALLACVALLLARPFLVAREFAPRAQGEALDVALVIDHSLSMGRRNDQSTLFEQALAQAEQMRTLLRPADTLSIVLAEHTPNVRTPQPVRAVTAADVIDALRQLPLPLTDADIPDAVQAARELLGRAPNSRKLIVILSDEQRSGFALSNEPAWRAALGMRTAENFRQLPVYLLGMPPTSGRVNLSVQPLTLEPGGERVGINRPLYVLATISCSGGGAGAGEGGGRSPESPVQLLVDGQLAQSQILPALAAGESRTLRFETRIATPGPHYLEVHSTAPDALEADNTASAALVVFNALPVLVVTPTADDLGGQFVMAALGGATGGPDGATETPGTALLRPALIAQAELARTDILRYAVVLLVDPTAPATPTAATTLATRLADYVQRGHGLWIVAGRRATPALYNQAFAKAGLLPGDIAATPWRAPASAASRPVGNPAAPAESQGGAGAGIALALPDHPALAVIARSARDPLAQVLVQEYWPLLSPLAPDSQVLMRLASSPAPGEGGAAEAGGIIAAERQGRVLLWTTGVDGRWGNLPLQPNFVSLLNEGVYHLSSGQSRGRQLTLEAGAPLVYTLPDTAPAGSSVTLRWPNGRTKSLAPARQGARAFVSETDTFLPGIYQVSCAGATLDYAVNFDRRELDPAVLSNADLTWLKERYFLTDRLVSPRALADVLGVSEGGLELWPYLAGLVFLLLIAETLLAWRALRLQGGAAPPVFSAIAGTTRPPGEVAA